jgi:GNAT superfamily N-acetyltransferase
MKITYEVLSAVDTVTTLEREQIVKFLHTHMGRYRDDRISIGNAIEYALSDRPHQSGFILMAKDLNEHVGVVVMNHTHMEGYIPENVLVYIATHGDYRGRGIGAELIQRCIELAKGDIALHVEHDNPARRLYERMGFENPYLEMRYRAK